MNVLDGRAAVQERLDALEDERKALITILEAYARLEALSQPERAVVAATAPASKPEADDPSPVVVPPATRRHRKETFVCSRCPQTFKTRGWRDRHEAKHPPIPDVAPSAGERIRRIPPAGDREYGVTVPA